MAMLRAGGLAPLTMGALAGKKATDAPAIDPALDTLLSYGALALERISRTPSASAEEGDDDNGDRGADFGLFDPSSALVLEEEEEEEQEQQEEQADFAMMDPCAAVLDVDDDDDDDDDDVPPLQQQEEDDFAIFDPACALADADVQNFSAGSPAAAKVGEDEEPFAMLDPLACLEEPSRSSVAEDDESSSFDIDDVPPPSAWVAQRCTDAIERHLEAFVDAGKDHLQRAMIPYLRSTRLFAEGADFVSAGVLHSMRKWAAAVAATSASASALRTLCGASSSLCEWVARPTLEFSRDNVSGEALDALHSDADDALAKFLAWLGEPARKDLPHYGRVMCAFVSFWAWLIDLHGDQHFLLEQSDDGDDGGECGHPDASCCLVGTMRPECVLIPGEDRACMYHLAAHIIGAIRRSEAIAIHIWVRPVSRSRCAATLWDFVPDDVWFSAIHELREDVRQSITPETLTVGMFSVEIPSPLDVKNNPYHRKVIHALQKAVDVDKDARVDPEPEAEEEDAATAAVDDDGEPWMSTSVHRIPPPPNWDPRVRFLLSRFDKEILRAEEKVPSPSRIQESVISFLARCGRFYSRAVHGSAGFFRRCVMQRVGRMLHVTGMEHRWWQWMSYVITESWGGENAAAAEDDSWVSVVDGMVRASAQLANKYLLAEFFQLQQRQYRYEVERVQTPVPAPRIPPTTVVPRKRPRPEADDSATESSHSASGTPPLPVAKRPKSTPKAKTTTKKKPVAAAAATSARSSGGGGGGKEAKCGNCGTHPVTGKPIYHNGACGPCTGCGKKALSLSADKKTNTKKKPAEVPHKTDVEKEQMDQFLRHAWGPLGSLVVASERARRSGSGSSVTPSQLRMRRDKMAIPFKSIPEDRKQEHAEDAKHLFDVLATEPRIKFKRCLIACAHCKDKTKVYCVPCMYAMKHAATKHAAVFLPAQRIPVSAPSTTEVAATWPVLVCSRQCYRGALEDLGVDPDRIRDNQLKPEHRAFNDLALRSCRDALQEEGSAL